MECWILLFSYRYRTPFKFKSESNSPRQFCCRIALFHAPSFSSDCDPRRPSKSTLWNLYLAQDTAPASAFAPRSELELWYSISYKYQNDHERKHEDPNIRTTNGSEERALKRDTFFTSIVNNSQNPNLIGCHSNSIQIEKNKERNATTED